MDVPDLGLSGLVPLSALEDDFYVFDPERGLLLGRRTKRVIRLGDRLEVQAHRVNRAKKQVDFRLAGSAAGRAAGRGSAHSTRKTSGRRKSARASRAEGARPDTRPSTRR